jgi:sugar-phosphatase
MAMTVQAILFDLDGVLVDSTANVERHWTEWAHKVGLDPAWLVPRVHGRRAIDTVRSVRPDLDAGAEFAALERAESEDTEGVTALPGARDLLARLPETTWAIVTSGTRPVASARLRAAQLPTPEAFVTADLIARGKPDPEGYLAAAARLGVPQSACLVVEDAPAGAAAARAAGMRLLALTTTHARDELGAADLVAPDLAAVQVDAASRNGRWRLTVSADA